MRWIKQTLERVRAAWRRFSTRRHRRHLPHKEHVTAEKRLGHPGD